VSWKHGRWQARRSFTALLPAWAAHAGDFGLSVFDKRSQTVHPGISTAVNQASEAPMHPNRSKVRIDYSLAVGDQPIFLKTVFAHDSPETSLLMNDSVVPT